MATTVGLQTSAARLSRSPLGLIALFVLLVDCLASIILTVGSNLSDVDQRILVIFIVGFPVLILAVFTWLVSRHANLLYGPGDYENDENFLRALAPLLKAQHSSDKNNPMGTATIEESASTVRAAQQRVSQTPPNRRRVLWVDDNPGNNTHLREAFERLGIQVDIALSTDDGLERASERDYGAIISDMGRREGPTEGYALLEKLRSSGRVTPFFIYAGSNSAGHRREAITRGAQGSTNRPNDLLTMVLASLS